MSPILLATAKLTVIFAPNQLDSHLIELKEIVFESHLIYLGSFSSNYVNLYNCTN